jgi:hypothetical protein
VLGFYFYYYVLAGQWSYYFSGVWTRDSDQATSVMQPGTHFSDVPVAVAAPLTLLCFAVVSVALFRMLELLMAQRGDAPDRARHRTLVVAGYVAFLSFYIFAGQPLLREAPSLVVEAAWLLVIIAATTMFWRRWGRCESDFVQERFAQKILRKWQWGDAPPSDRLQDIYLVHSERSREREARLAAYAETLREMVHDGVVSKGELVILDSLRRQLGITDKDHKRILDQLKEEDRLLFDPDHQETIEEQLQLGQYRRELLRSALVALRSGDPITAESLADSRDHYNISPEKHALCVAELSATSGPLADLLRAEIREVERLAAAASLDAAAESSSYDFLRYLCRWRGGRRSALARDFLRAIEDRAPFEESLAHALESLREPTPAPARPEPLLDLSCDESPYLRAAAVHLLTRFEDDRAVQTAVARTEDDVAIVRETAYHALRVRGLLDPKQTARALSDSSPAVRQAAVGDREESGKQLYATLNKRALLSSLTTLERMMFVQRVPLLAELDPEDLEAVTELSSERRLKAGQVLCKEGESGDELFLVLSGQVKAWRGDPSAPSILGVSGPGSCIGELAALGGGARSATLSAEEPTRVLVLSGVDVRNLLLRRPSVAQELIDVLVQRLQQALTS